MNELSAVPKDSAGNRRLRVLKEMAGWDNLLSSPRSLTVPPGTILTATASEAPSRGDLFFRINDTDKVICPHPPAFKVRSPYDSGAYNPEYLTEEI